jgi:hypothetical protein
MPIPLFPIDLIWKKGVVANSLRVDGVWVQRGDRFDTFKDCGRFWAVGRWKRRTSMKMRENPNKEPMNLMNSRNEAHERGATKPKRVGVRVYLGGSRRIVRKWTGFSHLETAFPRLFPDESMQVVDFPRIAYVRLFGEGKNSPQSRRDAEASGACNQYGKQGDNWTGVSELQVPEWKLSVQLSALKCA